MCAFSFLYSLISSNRIRLKSTRMIFASYSIRLRVLMYSLNSIDFPARLTPVMILISGLFLSDSSSFKYFFLSIIFIFITTDIIPHNSQNFIFFIFLGIYKFGSRSQNPISFVFWGILYKILGELQNRVNH